MDESNAEINPLVPDPDATQAMESSKLVQVLDQYMAELNSGAAPPREVPGTPWRASAVHGLAD